jgi:hypothetical protein
VPFIKSLVLSRAADFLRKIFLGTDRSFDSSNKGEARSRGPRAAVPNFPTTTKIIAEYTALS